MDTGVRISQAIEGYLLAKASFGNSDHTILANKWALGRLMDYLGDVPISEITHTQLQKFMLFMRSSYVPSRSNGSTAPLSGASLERIWSSMRGFFHWAEEEFGGERPDLRLPKPRYESPEVSPFSREELQKLLKASEYTRTAEPSNRRAFRQKRPTHLRDVALILLLIDTGIRASECARLQIEHVNLQSGEVEIKPHGASTKSRPRMVYLGRVAKSAIWKYIASRQDVYKHDLLFVTNSGRPMNRNSIRQLLGRIGDSAEVSNVHPHRFRHTFAIQYLRNGGDAFTLQYLLGHQTLDMVKKYLKIVKSDAANAHKTSSPADRWRL